MSGTTAVDDSNNFTPEENKRWDKVIAAEEERDRNRQNSQRRDITTVLQPPTDEDYNGWADFWRYEIGPNVIPWNKGEGKSNKVNWTEWQDKSIPQELHDYWKSTNAFKDGIAIILGKCWHKKPFNPRLRLWNIDSDKQSSIDAICAINGKHVTIEDLSKEFIVDMHEDDPTRLHIYGYYESDDPYPIVGSGKICELKCDGKHGIVRCINTIHEKGYRYKIIGTIQPHIKNAFVEHVLGICKVSTQNIDEHNGQNKPSRASTLWKDGATVNEGENRHAAMLSLMDSLLIKFPNENMEVIFQMVMAKNRLLCKDRDGKDTAPIPEPELRTMFEQCKEFSRKKLGEMAQPNITKRQQNDEQEEEPEEEEITSGPEPESQIRTISVSKALRTSDGFYEITGRLASYGSLYMMINGYKESICSYCHTVNAGRSYKKPVFVMHKDTRKCINCAKDIPRIPEYHPTIDIDLQDPDQISEVNRIQVHVFGEDTYNITSEDASETVVVTGNIYVEEKEGDRKARPVPVMYAHTIKYLGKVEHEPTPQDIQEINEWKERHKNDIIGGLISIFAPHVVGNEHCKEAMLMVDAMAGIPNEEDESNYIRYRIHQLLIGDPGEAKGRFQEVDMKALKAQQD